MRNFKYLLTKELYYLNFVNNKIFLYSKKISHVKSSKLILVQIKSNYVYIEKCFITSKQLESLLENLKLILTGIERFFFFLITIKGLGFRVRKYTKNLICFLRIELGYSHYIYYPLPKAIFFFKGKKKFLIYSHDYTLLAKILLNLSNLRKLNPYKEKGFLVSGVKMIKKKGKQSQK